MTDREEMLTEIIDDIEAGLIDDPVEDYKYLSEEVLKYKDHELAQDIFEKVRKMMFEDIPAAVRSNLKPDFSQGVDDFNFMIEEAAKCLNMGLLNDAFTILTTLMGSGLNFNDTDKYEYRIFNEEIQEIIYRKGFQDENKKIVPLPVNLSRLYGLLGVIQVEKKQLGIAQKLLALSLHYDPLDFDFFFEFAETFKMTNNLRTFEDLSRKYLLYAYRARYIARLYRNLGFIYIEKEKYDVAQALFEFAKAYDPSNPMPDHELEFIAHKTGRQLVELTQEEGEELLKSENIQLGVSDSILRRIMVEAMIAAGKRDVPRTEYFCNLIYDVTRNQQLVDNYMSEAKSPPIEQPKPAFEFEDYYTSSRIAAMKKLFPTYPEIKECKLKITFTIVSTKYEQTIYQLLTHIDDMSKLVDKKNVSVLFTDYDAVLNNLTYIHELNVIAGKWKSYNLTINDIPCGNIYFRYFMDSLPKKLVKALAYSGTAETIRKKYAKEAGPKRAKKQSIEEQLQIDISGCTAQEVLAGIVSAYINVYLNEYDVQTLRTPDDEYVLTVNNNEFVVAFWLVPSESEPNDETKPYEFTSFYIQELTKNTLFKFNAAAFRRIFNDIYLGIHSLTYKEPDAYIDEVNRFYKIDKAFPELRLKERQDATDGEPYTFIIFEMDNADGSVGKGIGFTNKAPKTLLKKVCKELETKNHATLTNNGANGLIFQYSETLIAALNSWKGEKRLTRIENHLRYYCLERPVKNIQDTYSIPDVLMQEEAEGKFEGIERKTYADIKRR